MTREEMIDISVRDIFPFRYYTSVKGMKITEEYCSFDPCTDPIVAKQYSRLIRDRFQMYLEMDTKLFSGEFRPLWSTLRKI